MVVANTSVAMASRGTEWWIACWCTPAMCRSPPRTREKGVADLNGDKDLEGDGDLDGDDAGDDVTATITACQEEHIAAGGVVAMENKEAD